MKLLFLALSAFLTLASLTGCKTCEAGKGLFSAAAEDVKDTGGFIVGALKPPFDPTKGSLNVESAFGPPKLYSPVLEK